MRGAVGEVAVALAPVGRQSAVDAVLVDPLPALTDLSGLQVRQGQGLGAHVVPDGGAGVDRLSDADDLSTERFDFLEVGEGLLEVAAEPVVAVGHDGGDGALAHHLHELLDAGAGERPARDVEVLLDHHGPPWSAGLRDHARDVGVHVPLLQLGGNHLLPGGGNPDVDPGQDRGELRWLLESQHGAPTARGAAG